MDIQETDSKPSILIIDDDHIYRVIIAEFLRKAGYKIASMFGGEHALKFLTRSPLPQINLIILDYKMPELSGIEVLEKLYSMPIVKHIPIIMVSAFASEEERQIALKYKIANFLFKPIQETILLETIKRVLAE